MDDPQGYHISEAATTRKRRSSILKNQRPSRTPFSELEFNVATPTDTAKSRRVSFSRRTGVAEFVTNEATNTWKTIYVEQNKSFESSGNESGMNQPHQTVGCLGKRIFDQQFEEIEVVDYGGNIITTDNMRMQQMNMSMNVNFTQQIASLESDLDEKKLSVPEQNFELSALTDHKSNLFVDNILIPAIEDLSNKIDINFSAIQPIGLGNDKYDDLDEIQEAFLKSGPKNFQGPFMNKKNITEYTEVNLNTTHVATKNDIFDMSITETIQSPKVQEVSISNMCVKNDKKVDINNDWIADKENIAINPYIAPKESVNFAINEMADQVLVFDGRKLTVQSEKNVTYNKDDAPNFNNINLLNSVSSGPPPHRKTFVLNINDDLPNFVNNAPVHGQIQSFSKCGVAEKHENNVNKEALLKQNIPRRSGLFPNANNTIIYDSGDIADISVTHVIPSNILGKSEKRKTIVFENDTGNLSMTQVVPTNVVMVNNEIQTNKTVLYEEDDISFTQAVPLNAFFNKTNIEENSIPSPENRFDVSFTQAVPNNLVISNKGSQTKKRHTIIFENDSNDISITRVLPSNILNCENQIELPVIIENDIVDEKLKKQILSEKNILCKVVDKYGSQDVTKLNDKDHCDISETRILPTNIIEPNKTILKDAAKLKNNLEELSITNENMSITEAIPDKIFYTKGISNNKTKTFNDVNETCDISVTQVLPTNIITDPEKKLLIQELKTTSVDSRYVVDENFGKIKLDKENANVNSNCHNTTSNKTNCDSDRQPEVIFTTCSSNKTPLDKTNIVELNISVNAECTKVYKSHMDMSITQVIHPNDTLHNRADVSKRETIDPDSGKNDIPVTQSITTNILLGDDKLQIDNKTLFDDKDSNKENPSSISLCNCMVITSTQPCQIHICTHSNFSISKDIPLNHTINKQLELQCKKSDLVDRETNLLNMSLNKNDPHLSEQNEILLKSMNYLDGMVQNLETSSHKSVTDHNYQDVFVYQAVTSHNVSKHHVGRSEQDEEEIERTTKNDRNKSSTDLTRPNHIVGRLFNKDEKAEKKEETKEIKKLIKKHKRNSFLCKLLNMSNESINLSSEGIDDKNVMAVIASQNEIETSDKYKLGTNEYKPKQLEADSESREESIGTKSYLYQRKEIDNNTQADNPSEKSINSSFKNISDKSLNIVESRTDSYNKNLERRKADDTNDSLEMVSDFTDKTIVKELNLNEDCSNSMDVKYQDKTENFHHITEKTEDNQENLKPSNITKSRISMMINREDLLDNISKVQAALQQARDIDDSEMFNCTNDTTEGEPDEIVVEFDRRSRQPRVSGEVVKTLQFDDSTIDINSSSNTNLSPLKKTAVSNISSLQDGKGKVIPPFLTDVSDDIKSLMKDLVKPAADVMPFETGVDKIIDKKPKERTSTNSIEIQANIIASSQIDIDIDSDLVSECNSFGLGKINERDQNRHSLATTRPKLANSDGSEGTGKFSNNFRKNVLSKPYLVFDHANPLNNVILSPTGTTEVHNYCPINPVYSKSVSETTVNISKAMSEHSRRSSFSDKDGKSDDKVKIVSTQYNVKIDPIRSDKQIDESSNKTSAGPCFDAVCCEKKSVPILVNDYQRTIKDTEVNTLIAMKCNEDLLQTSSSLTIVDEDKPKVFVVDHESIVTSTKKSKKTSPVKVIFKLDDQDIENSELSELSDSDNIKAKKRIYSPAAHDYQRKVIPPGPDTTPKPCSKVQKLSTSPMKSHINRASTAKLNTTPVVEHIVFGSEKSCKSNPTRKSPKSFTTSSKPRNSIIVHRMSAECNISNTTGTKDLRMRENIDSESSSTSTLKTETISQRDFSSTHTTDSFVSSVAMKVADFMPSSITTTTSEGVGSINSDRSPDYPVELEDQDFNTGAEVDCVANVISKIDKLPFIGTRECEWDHSDLDNWRFLMMRRALRLTVRLKWSPCARALTDGDQRRRCVHGDAPVAGTSVDHMNEETDAVAATCVRLASEAMRYECVRGAAAAGDVPALLRRCVGVARVARRWAQAMREARVHLAYTLADSGRLVLKVANIPLRSVYEVTMRIELVVEDAREAAWARAGHVTLRDVTYDLGEKGEHAFEAAAGQKKRNHAAEGDRDGTERWMPDVQRIVARVPHDWGHVPKTLWKVFRYLKNKTKDDPLGTWFNVSPV